jgi:hypothetical protein
LDPHFEAGFWKRGQKAPMATEKAKSDSSTFRVLNFDPFQSNYEGRFLNETGDAPLRLPSLRLASVSL